MYPYDDMTFTGYQPQFTGYQPTYTKPVIPQNQNTQLNTFQWVQGQAGARSISCSTWSVSHLNGL